MNLIKTQVAVFLKEKKKFRYLIYSFCIILAKTILLNKQKLKKYSSCVVLQTKRTLLRAALQFINFWILILWYFKTLKEYLKIKIELLLNFYRLCKKVYCV